jgi:hypothetical protein
MPSPHAFYLKMLRHDPCCFCGRTLPPWRKVRRSKNKEHITRDHIRPSSDGGNSLWINLTAACNKCNTKKSHLSLLEFLLGGKPHSPALDSSFQSPLSERLPKEWDRPLNSLLDKLPHG